MKRFDHTSGNVAQVGDARIYYEITGDVKGPVWVLLHGGFGTMADLNPLLEALPEECSVLGIDSRGHGQSSLGSGKLTYETLQHDVEELLRELHVTDFSVIGFSDGGIVAYRLAALGKFNVEKIITIGATWHYDDALATEDLFRSVTPGSWKAKFPETVETYERLNPAPDFERFTEASVAMWLDDSTTGYPGERVKACKAPLLIIRGENDHLFSDASARKLAGLVADSTVKTIPGAGHEAHKDQPEAVREHIRSFIAAGQ